MKYCPKEICKLDCKDFFLFGARHAFGVWLLYVGLSKWIFTGSGNFVGYIEQTFAATWAPGIMITALAWIILVAEPILGLLLIIGKCQRCVWLITAKLMFILMFGQTMIQKYDTVANNWQYVVLALVCAAMCGPVCGDGEGKGSCKT